MPSRESGVRANELSRSFARRFSLVHALEPDGHAARGLDGDNAAKKPIATLLGDNVVIQPVSATGRDDVVELISRVELELPAETMRVSRFLLRRALKPDDRFSVLNSKEPRKFIALIHALEPEQLIEGT